MGVFECGLCGVAMSSGMVIGLVHIHFIHVLVWMCPVWSSLVACGLVGKWWCLAVQHKHVHHAWTSHATLACGSYGGGSYSV